MKLFLADTADYKTGPAEPVVIRGQAPLALALRIGTRSNGSKISQDFLYLIRKRQEGFHYINPKFFGPPYSKTCIVKVGAA